MTDLTHRSARNQQGAALITALIILVALTVLGVSAFKTTNLEELMAGNLRDQQLSFQAAESALSAAEDDIDDLVNVPTPTSTGIDGIYTRDKFTDFSTSAYNASVWGDHGTVALSDLAEVNSDPKYIAQFEAFIPDDLSVDTQATGMGRFYYRLTTRGEGTSANAVTLLQETYGKRYR